VTPSKRVNQTSGPAADPTKTPDDGSGSAGLANTGANDMPPRLVIAGFVLMLWGFALIITSRRREPIPIGRHRLG
jgi:hypothetical protein